MGSTVLLKTVPGIPGAAKRLWGLHPKEAKLLPFVGLEKKQIMHEFEQNKIEFI